MAKPVSRDQIFRREREQGNVNSLYLADHEQVWQSYPVDPYSDDFTYIVYLLYIQQYTGTYVFCCCCSCVHINGVPHTGSRKYILCTEY